MDGPYNTPSLLYYRHLHEILTVPDILLYDNNNNVDTWSNEWVSNYETLTENVLDECQKDGSWISRSGVSSSNSVPYLIKKTVRTGWSNRGSTWVGWEVGVCTCRDFKQTRNIYYRISYTTVFDWEKTPSTRCIRLKEKKKKDVLFDKERVGNDPLLERFYVTTKTTKSFTFWVRQKFVVSHTRPVRKSNVSRDLRFPIELVYTGLEPCIEKITNLLGITVKP